MARLIPQKQIEEVNIFKDSISVNNSVIISGSLYVSQSVNIGSSLLDKQEFTGSVEITGSLNIDGNLSFANADSRLDATASFADVSLDTQLFAGIRPEDFVASEATIYVSATKGSDDNDGRSPAFPLRTIKKAAQLATPGDDGRYGLPTGSLFTGYRIEVDTGTYLEENPIELPRNTTVWGSGLRVTKIVAKNENEDLFWVNSGCYLSEMTFAGLRVYPSVDDSQKGFAIAFAPNAFITTSPYVQNCSMISNQENSFLEAYEEIPAGGGGLNVDGNKIHPDSPLASMVLDAYTQIAPNGVGCQVVGRGFIQLVSFFTNFSAYSVKVLDGGQAVLLNSNTSFGDYGMYASGSRFITGSGGNTDAFLNVQDNYSIIVNTIEKGLSAIPALVPNAEAGIRITDPNVIEQYFVSEDSSIDVAEAVRSDFRLVSSIVENGNSNVPTLIAKSSTAGYSPTSVYNISGQTQYTSSLTASVDDISSIDTNFDILLDVIRRGNAATSSYVEISNVSHSIQISDIEQYKALTASTTTIEKVSSGFNTIMEIISTGITPVDVESNTSASYKATDTTIYETDISSSQSTIDYVSSSLSIVYDILANGTASSPEIIPSSSTENPTIEIQNAYELLINNIPFIQDETIVYLSSSWSEHPYDQDVCKRDIGYIVSGAAHDLLYGGNEESVRSGLFYYLYPSNATTSELDPTLTGIKYASGLVQNILSGKVFSDTTVENENGYDVIFQNKDFVIEETILYVSSSWSGFDYNEAKCRRDVGYILDAVGTDLRYDGNERSVTAGEFYYKYPSQATSTQLNQTIDAINYAKRLTEKLLNNDTFGQPSASVIAAVDLMRENRSLIQDETITFINTQYPNFDYNQTKCRRDVGYIIDNIATDLLYGGNERTELAGLYYFLYPSIANTTQLTETLLAIEYVNGMVDEIVQSNVLSTPQIILNVDGNIKVTTYNSVTSSVSATDTEVTLVSQSFNIVEDIIRYGTDYITSTIAGNSNDYIWTTSSPINVSGRTQITSSDSDSANLQTLESNFGIVTDIISEGPSVIPNVTSSWENTIKVTDTPQYISGSSTASSTEASSISESISLVSHIVQSGIKSFTPTTATYDPSNGDFVMTISNHTLDTSDSIYLKPESFTFTCEMDGNRTEHNLPAVGQIAYTNRLPVTSTTTNTVTVNVGASGPNVEFNPTNSSYDPSTGDFVITVASHSLSVGEGIVLSAESFAFTCEMDNDQTTKSYPRVGIDPYAVRSLPITAVTDTTMTVNVGASGPNKYFTPSAASYNASTGDMVVTVGQHGLGVGRSVVLENESFAFTCDQDGNATTHSYPRVGSDPYAGKSIVITSVGTTSHTITDAPYDSATGDVTITIASHGFSNGDYIKLDDNSLTYTCVLDGNVTEKSYPRAGYDYPSGRWLEISNVTTNTFDINIGSSPYVGAHTFVSATSNGLKRQDGTFTINVGDAGSASGAVHTFVSASSNAVKHEPQSVHTFVSASNGAVKHLPQSAHTFVRTDSDSVTTLPVLTENTDGLIKVGSVSENTTYSGSLTEATKVSSSFATITNIVENGVGVIPTIVSNVNENIKFNNDSVQYISSSFSGSLEDVSFVSSSISYVTTIIANGTGSYTASEYPSQPLSSSNAIAAYQILRNNLEFIKDETISYLSSSWSTASYDESKCRRDVGLIISGAAEDLIWGTVSSSIVNGRFYYDYPSQAQGAQLNQTLDGIFFASEVAQKLIQNIEFVTASAERRGAWNTITNNEEFIKEEMIQYLSSSWSTFDYNEATCRRDAGYILDAVKTDIYYGGNERSSKAGEFYYLYPSAAILSGSVSPTSQTQLVPTLDGLRYAGRITEAIVTGSSFSFPSQAKLDAKNVLLNNKQFVQDETIAYLSSSWSEFDYNQTTCKRDIGFIIDAAVTDVVYGGNERSRIAANFYYRYPSAAIVGGVPSTTQQKDPTVDGIKFAGGISEKVVLGDTFTSADSTAITIKNSIIDNKSNIQQNVIDYINDTYPNLNYNNDKCYRDVGFIIDAVVTDLVYGGNGRSVQAGSFYYRFPSQATYSQLTETIDGINFARDLVKLTAKGAKSVEDSFDVVVKIIESGSSVVTEQTIGTDSNGAPISTVGIPKNSYGDNLVTTVVGTTIPAEIELVKNTDAGIKFGNDVQITSSLSAGADEISKVSSSFSIVSDIVKYGITPTSQLSGSSEFVTYYEVVTLEEGNYLLNKNQLSKFDNVFTESFDDGIIDPTITLKRGELYTFSVNSLNIVNKFGLDLSPFYIKTKISSGTNDLYNDGVTGNGTSFGTLTFIVPFDAPDELYYVNGNNISASGFINIVDELPISDTQRVIEIPSLGEFDVITNNVDNIKINDIDQYTSQYTASNGQSLVISSSFATTVDILINGVGNLPTQIKNVDGLVKKNNIQQYTSSVDTTEVLRNTISSSFDIVLDIVENGTGSIPTIVENITDLIKVTSETQYVSSVSASNDEIQSVSSSFGIVLDILKNGVDSFTPTTATYDPSNGEFVMTIPNHTIEENDGIYLRPESFTFTCEMDGNKTEHKLPASGQPAYTNKLDVTSTTTNTVTVNVGASGPNVQFTPSNATYNPSTGDLVLTIGSHTLSVGEGIVIATGSLAFTCDMDDNQSTKSYPRLGIDPYAGRSMSITAADSTTITVNVGAAGSNKYFTPVSASYNALSGDMVVTTDIPHGLGVGRSVVLESSSFAFTCDQDGNTTTHSYPRIGTDPYAGKSIQITSVGYTEHTATDAPYNPSTGVVTLTIPSHGFSNGDYVKISDSSLTYTCVLDGNTTEKSYPRAGYDYPSGRWLPISNVTTNTFDINIGSSTYVGTHTFVTSSLNGVQRQDNTFTINVGDAGSASGSIHTFVSASTNAVKFEPQSAHTFVSASTNAVKHLPQSEHTFVRTESNSVSFVPNLVYNISDSIKKTTIEQYISASSATQIEITKVSSSVAVVTDIISNGVDSLPIVIDNTSELIKVTTTEQYTGSLSGSLEDVEAISSSISIVTDVIANGLFGLPTVTAYTASVSTPSTLAAYEILKENIDFIQNETIAYLSSSWSTASYDESKCRRDVGLIISGAAEDLLFGSVSSSVVNGYYYYIFPSKAETSQLNQTLDGVFYASKLAQQLVQNSIFVTASSERLLTAELITNNTEFIQEETIAYLSSSWSSFDYNETTCKRDVGYILDAVKTDIVYGGNERSVKAGEFYYLYPSAATGSQLNQTLDGINYAGKLAQRVIQNIGFVTASEFVSASYDLIVNNIDFVKEETIAYLSSSWSGFSYNETTCKRDVGYILDAVATDLYYGGNERSITAGEFYYLYPSNATGSELIQTLDGINYARRLVNEIIQNNEFALPPFSRTNAVDVLIENKLFIQEEVISYVSSSWSGVFYNEDKCKRDVGYILDAVATDTLYGGNERSSKAGEFYYLYPSRATNAGVPSEQNQLDSTLDGIIYAKLVSDKLLQNEIFVTASTEVVEVVKLITENKPLIQAEVISYISSSWSNFEYNEASCSRDVGYILDAVATDFYYGGNERSITAGEFYYLFPSAATVSGSESPNVDAQLYPTVDGVTYAQRLTNKLVNNVTLVTASLERQTTYNLLVDNKELLQNEVISFMSSSWSGFEYIEAKCRRDVGYIVDAVATDVLYGGNERSVTAGEFYYLYPSEATTVQSDQTITGINHAAGLADKIVQNTLLVNPNSDLLTKYNLILDNKELVQDNVIRFVDMKYPYFTYNRVKCRRDVGFIIDAVATDLLWGGNERSIIAGDYYYRYPSEATTIQLGETTEAIRYAKGIVKQILLNNLLEVPSVKSNTENNIRFTDTTQYTGSLAISGSNLTDISSSFEIVTGIITSGISSYTPTTATYNPANGDFTMTIVRHGLDVGDSIYLKPESFTFTCEMDGNRTEHKLPAAGQPAYNNRLTIKSVTTDTVTVNVGASGPNIEFNPTNATYDPATGDFVVTVASHSLSVGEGIVMEPESFAFTCEMDDNQSVKSYPRVGIDPFAVRSIPLTAVTDTTMTFNVGASGPNKYFTPVSASYNALTGDMTLTVSESFGLGVGRSVVLENESFAFTCDMDGNATTHSYPRSGSDPYAGKSIVITSVGTTSHTPTDAPYNPSTGVVTLTIANHGFSNGDYVKVDDGALTYTCVSDNNQTEHSYPRAGYDYPSGRWLEISNVTTNTFDINVGPSSYLGEHTFVSATTGGVKRQDGTFTINVGDAGSASGSIHTFVSASLNAVKYEPQSVHTFVSASNGAIKHLPQSTHTFVRTQRDSVTALPIEVKNIENLIKVTDATQTTSSLSGSSTEVGIVSASIDMINDIIRFGSDNIPFAIAKHFQTYELDTPQNLTTGRYVTASGDYEVGNELAIVTSSFTQINDVITNGLTSLPTLVLNTTNNIKVTNVTQYTSSLSGSSTETSKVSASVDIIETIVQNGVGSIPTIVENNTNTSNLIKVGNVEQYISASGADKIQSKIVSSSFGTVIDILVNGTGSLPTIVEYTTQVDAPKTVLAYNLLKENIEFIKNETILFMSSSWSGFEYNEASCSRDVGLIVNGVADDLIYNANSASVVNGYYYYLFPSQATGSQLDQTVTAIRYASNLAQNIVRNYEYVTASAEVSASYDLLIQNKEFIVSESIAFVSSSWSDFYYNQNTCGRDVRYIVDAVATDLLYGGNERSVTAGRYYYDYPSSAIVGGVPSSTQQKDPTVTAINYVKGLVTEIVGGAVFQTASNEVEHTYEAIRTNRGFIQNEVIAFVNAKYPNLFYNEASCSRDTGFIVDAVATDLRWGGNQRSREAGRFYYLFPSKATNIQLDETTDAVTYASDLVTEIVLKNTLSIPSASLNTDNNIKVTSATQTLGTGTTDTYVLNTLSSSFGLVMDIVLNGTGSLPTISDYTQSLTDSEILEAYSLIKSNIGFIQSESIAYISSSWSEFEYNEASCSRDVGLIVSGAAEDLLFGSVSSSVVNGYYYYLFPSAATGSQLNQTLDGIRYAARLTNKIVQSVTLEYPSTEASSSWELLRSNKEFIQSESIAYISSSWSSFGYNEDTCKRDIGYIIDAVATDIKYGGNERSVTAGDFYYRYPSNATTSELEPTTTGIEYAGDMAEKVIVNQLFQSPSSESIAGNETLLRNRGFIQNEVIAYISSSWSQFEYNEASCSRDTGFIVDAVATDFLYGGNERSRTAGEYYFKFPSSATVAGSESPSVNAQLYPTIDGVRYASRIAQKLVQNIEFVTASNEVSASWNLLRDNKEFIQNEVIAYISSSWSGVTYNEDKCKRDVGYIIDAAATDLYYGGQERSVTAGSFYYLFPSRATVKGTPSEAAQLDPTIDGVRYANGLSTKVMQNVTFVEPSAEVLVGADLLISNKSFIQAEVIEYLSSSWSEFEYNEVSCSRDLGYIIDAARTDLVYGGNERSIKAGTFYYYIPSIATTEQKPQTLDGIDFAKGMAKNVILKEQLVRPSFQTRESVDYLRASKKYLQSIAISYTAGAFPDFVYNEEKCYRDTGFIVDAIATDLLYGGNERSIRAAESYYTGVYGSAAVVITEQKKETAETNRYLRTQFQRIVRNSPLEEFGSLIITTGHDFSYAGAGVTYKALPPNQGGAGVPDPDKEITELAGGRVYFTSGNELGDFRIGTGLVINQATGTLQGRTFSRSLFSLVTPFSLALEG